MNDFNYILPQNINEALNSISKGAVSLAGGTDILGMMKNNLMAPKNILNLKTIPELKGIVTTNDGLKIGALTKLSEIAEDKLIIQKFNILSQAAKSVASPQIRNVGTIGGNILQRPRCWYFRGEYNCLKKGGDYCYAEVGENKYHAIIGGDPCYIVHPSDVAVALLALDATLSIVSKKGSREVKIKDFFIRPEEDVTKENILTSDEIVTTINIPHLEKNTQSEFYKFSERGVWDFAVVSVGAVIQKVSGKIKAGKLTFGGVAPIPWMDKDLNKKLSGLSLDEKSITTFSKDVFKNAEPLEFNEYKVKLAQGLVIELLSRFV